MSDWMLEIGKRPWAKTVYERLPLPIKLPTTLERSNQPWPAKPLADKPISLAGAASGSVERALGERLERAGAKLTTSGGRHALIFDATGAAHPGDLESLYRFVHGALRSLSANGRIIVIGRGPESLPSTEAVATQESLQGFVRSVAKEIGGRGATAHLVYLPENGGENEAVERLAGPLLYLLSPRSAFVSGQVLKLSPQAAPPGLSFPETLPLKNKRAVVTGAAQGIGLAIAAALAREGAAVMGVDHPSQSEKLDAAMKGLGGLSVPVDLGEALSAETVAKAIREAWGAVDVLVNNAGITRDKKLANMARDSWDVVIRVNLEAPLRLTQAITGKSGLLADHGRLVYLSSVVGLAGNVGQANYAAAKAGLLGLVRAESERLRARGITVNALAPGYIDTPMTRKMPLALREMARRTNSLKQGGTPDDVAEAAVFLASQGAFSLTGATLRVCGQSLLGA